ncbi:HalOD1 output domain-containing protein [Natrialbaceae archaeon A-CW2]|uniref:HalOD1 output domain-containing protein n=1 Tax=Natronosalvus amylolyticus TaxID=2961994 RepID=UPI0020C93DED|nr:HalOD1 output domain-containing protein [Natronosalvus amylolyticus]
MPQMDTGNPTGSMSMRVIDAIAAEAGVDPLELDTPLFEAVNPEALDRLFRDEVNCRVTFDYDEYEITVSNDGTVTVDGSTYRP